MLKRIVPILMLCLVLFSIFAITSKIQLTKASEEIHGYIPVGTYVVTFPDPSVSLNFTEVTVAGWATATPTTNYPPPPPLPSEDVLITATDSVPAPGFIGPVWNIKVNATFLGNVIVGINYGEGSVPTQMLQTDIVPGDVNFDGKVNCKDLLLILKAMGSRPGDPRWNPNCDLNHNNKIDCGDLLIALKNYGKTSQWIDITTGIDTTLHIIYGTTDHFSFIAIH